MDVYDEIENFLAKSKNGTFTTSDFSKAGLRRSVLKELLEGGEISRFSRGIYVREDAWEDDFYL
ncbi:MAG: type IV toxin-antitoxin system AbiEi family antitoxin domain-containing protein, partial [Candidatus Enteromonas sp.]